MSALAGFAPAGTEAASVFRLLNSPPAAILRLGVLKGFRSLVKFQDYAQPFCCIPNGAQVNPRRFAVALVAYAKLKRKPTLHLRLMLRRILKALASFCGSHVGQMPQLCLTA